MVRNAFGGGAAVSPRPPVSLVSSDPHARKHAARHSFGIIEDRENAGESAAIEMATQVCVQRGIAWTLVIPGDAPLVTAKEIETILKSAPDAGSVLAPDAKGRGSNAVLRCPADLFPLRFGNDSFAPHLESARVTGMTCVVLHLPGIA